MDVVDELRQVNDRQQATISRLLAERAALADKLAEADERLAAYREKQWSAGR